MYRFTAVGSTADAIRLRHADIPTTLLGPNTTPLRLPFCSYVLHYTFYRSYDIRLLFGGPTLVPALVLHTTPSIWLVGLLLTRFCRFSSAPCPFPPRGYRVCFPIVVNHCRLPRCDADYRSLVRLTTRPVDACRCPGCCCPVVYTFTTTLLPVTDVYL